MQDAMLKFSGLLFLQQSIIHENHKILHHAKISCYMVQHEKLNCEGKTKKGVNYPLYVA